MSKLIMSVDDSASIRQMVSFTLKTAGYEVIEATDGSDAFNKLCDSKVDLILADLNMPNMDGIELIQKVRSNSVNKFTPIIMLTTESQEEKKQQGRNAGATGWIVKPFKPEQLVNVIKKVIG